MCNVQALFCKRRDMDSAMDAGAHTSSGSSIDAGDDGTDNVARFKCDLQKRTGVLAITPASLQWEDALDSLKSFSIPYIHVSSNMVPYEHTHIHMAAFLVPMVCTHFV